MKTDFTKNQCAILNMIKNSASLSNVTSSEIARDIQISQGHKDFVIVMNYLKSIDAIQIIEKRASLIILRLNYKMIKNLLDEQDYINWWVETFIKKDHTFIW
jgi:hypothetical protein